MVPMDNRRFRRKPVIVGPSISEPPPGRTITRPTPRADTGKSLWVPQVSAYRDLWHPDRGFAQNCGQPVYSRREGVCISE